MAQVHQSNPKQVVSVDEVSVQGIEVWIGLGSNLSKPAYQLELALTALQKLAKEGALCCSSFYLSKALLADKANEASGQQPDYVNAVVRFQTTLLPHDLLLQLQLIEATQGRVRDDAQPRWSPRTLDLDLLLYGKQQIDTPTLTVPHPGIRLREFVLYPMAELSSTLEIPGLGRLKKWVERCPRRGMEILNKRSEEPRVESAS